MAATSPDQICDLFKQYMAEGDIEAVLSIYDPAVAFLNRSGTVVRGKQGLRAELVPLAGAKTAFELQHPADYSDGRYRVDAHPVEGVFASADVAGCDGGCTSPTRWNMVLADWRPLYG